jgi:type III secretion protein U
VAFLAVIALLPGAVGALVDRASFDARAAILAAARPKVSTSFDAAALAAEVLALTAPLLLAAMVTSAAVFAVQTGGFIATKKLAPNLDRLNVFAGIKRLFSGARVFAVARALLGGGIVAWIVSHELRTHAVDLARSSGRLGYAAAVAAQLAYALARDAAIVGIALGGIDLFVMRRGWRKRLRMTKEEVKREVKDSEGDPQIKQQRERAHQEMLAAATIGNVRTASVVVVNPTHLACALSYDDREHEAPVVVASGEGELAVRILRAAQDYGVPIVRDVPLARALRELQIGDEIPEALYEAVAEILREISEDRPEVTAEK